MASARATGAIVGAVWIIGIPAIDPNNQVLALLASSLGLLILLLYFPRGLNQITYDVRNAILAWAERRFGTQTIKPAPGAVRPGRLARKAPGAHAAVTRDQVLTVSDVSVRFAGNLAVNAVSLHVCAHEVVGLIGANGAGKSTLMNAIGGFVPSTGSVQLLERGHQLLVAVAAEQARLGPDLPGCCPLPRADRAGDGVGRLGRRHERAPSSGRGH